MRVVIVGSGRVGAELGTLLSIDGHEVAIIDRNPANFRRLGKGFTGTVIEGNAFDEDVLRRAGIETADAFASVTAGDNTNYVLAAMARNRFKVPRVVTRIYDPLRANIYRRLGVPTIAPTVWGATKIRELLTYAGLTVVQTVANGEVEVVDAEISALLAGIQVKDLSIPGETQVVAVIRGGSAFIPSSLTKLEKGDRVLISVLTSALPRLESMLSP